MKLSEIMSAAGLALYPAVALVLFLSAFAVIAARLLTARRRDLEHAAMLPLADDDAPGARNP